MNTRTKRRFLPHRWLAASVGAATVFAVTLSGQSLPGPFPGPLPLSGPLLGPKASPLQHVTAEASAAPAGPSAGKPSASKLVLNLDVTPKANIQVYAAGSKEFSAVSLVVTPRAGISLGKPVYPAPHPALIGEAPGLDAALTDAPAYRKPFRITQPITVRQPLNEDLIVAGVLNYQACDNRLCYPVASLPVTWTIRAR